VKKRNTKAVVFEEVGKKIYENLIPDTYLIHFENETEVNGKVKKVPGIGEINQHCAVHFFQLLNSYNIPSSFLMSKPKDEIVVQKYEKLPIQVKIFNHVDRNSSKIFNVKVNERLITPIFEFYYDSRSKNLINESHLLAFNIATLDESKLITRIASKVNAILKSYFDRRNYNLAELNLEFGKFQDRIYLTSTFGYENIKLIPKDDSVSLIITSITPRQIKESFINFQKLIY
jgi:phosphoribosylaminoimidazole-succinocarboxamide synthase